MKYERSLQWRRIILLSFLAAVNRILCHCHKGNSAFVFSVFLIFMVAAAAFAPLLHHCHTTVNCTGSYRQVEDCMFLCGFLSLFFFSLSLSLQQLNRKADEAHRDFQECPSSACWSKLVDVLSPVNHYGLYPGRDGARTWTKLSIFRYCDVSVTKIFWAR